MFQRWTIKVKNKEQCNNLNGQSNNTCTKDKGDKNCQCEKSVMCPVKPAKQSSFKKKHIPLYKDKNHKATISYKKQKKCEYTDSKSQVSRSSDKDCQEKKNSVMQSVTNADMWLPKPVPNEYRRMCSDKNCQSTRCYSTKKKSPVKLMNKYDKNCQSV